VKKKITVCSEMHTKYRVFNLKVNR